MFTMRLPSGRVPSPPGCTPPAGGSPDRSFAAGGIHLRIALLGSLALGYPQMSSAQGLGTMQVSARVVSASVAWAGVAEAREATRGAARELSGRPLVRRGRMIQSRAEIRRSGRGRLLIVTIHHPHN